MKQKRWDPERDVEVGSDETVKGWEVSKGRYLPVEDAELERFAARQEKTIQILGFVELSEVDPVYYERAYWLEPQERAERPYVLLRTAMEESGRAALGRFVLSTKEHLVLLRPTGGILALETLYYPEDVRIRDQREVADRLEGVEVSKDELAMAEQLVEGLAKPFKPEEYPNETRAALVEFLEAKAAGEEIAEPEEAREPAPVVDLMAALKASLAAAEGGGGPEGDDQLSIEQSRLRKVEGGGEGDGKPKSTRSKAKTPAKKSGTSQRRRKAS